MAKKAKKAKKAAAPAQPKSPYLLLSVAIMNADGAAAAWKAVKQRLGLEQHQWINDDLAIIRMDDGMRREALLESLEAINKAHSPQLFACFTVWVNPGSTWSLSDRPSNYPQIEAMLEGYVL